MRVNSHNQYLIIREHISKCVKNDDMVHLIHCHLLTFVYFPYAKRFYVRMRGNLVNAIVFDENFGDMHAVVYGVAVPLGDQKYIPRDWQALFPEDNPGERVITTRGTTSGVRVTPFALPYWVMDFLFSKRQYFVSGELGIIAERIHWHRPPKVFRLDPPPKTTAFALEGRVIEVVRLLDGANPFRAVNQ